MARLDLPSERYVSTFSCEDASLSSKKEPRKWHLAETESRAGTRDRTENHVKSGKHQPLGILRVGNVY
jgi:hypothetical protein